MHEQITKPFRYKPISLERPEQSDTLNRNRTKPKDWLATLKRIWKYLAVYRMQLFFLSC